MREERSFRGISQRLARHYLSNLGGEVENDDRVVGEDWEAELSADKVSIGRSLSLTEVTIVFEGEKETLEPLIEKFAQKAMRAGG